jgi:polyhydroxybutyrate depolymerase
VLRICIVALTCAVASGAAAPADPVFTLNWGGRQRSYILHVPPSTDTRPRPLVIALHGGASTAAGMQRYSGLDDAAFKHHFVVAYPDGSGRRRRALTWNAGLCCGFAMTRRGE